LIRLEIRLHNVARRKNNKNKKNMKNRIGNHIGKIEYKKYNAHLSNREGLP
jgi:hypothetical protein